MPVAPRGMPSESVFLRPSPESDAVAFAPAQLSPEARQVQAAGWQIGRDGMEISL